MAIIIYPKTLDWTYMKQRPQQLMIELGKLGHTVFFENLNPLDHEYIEVAKNVFLFSDCQRFINTKLKELRRTQKVVVWTTWSKLRTRIQIFQPDKVVYDCCDEFPQWAQYEHSMIQVADHVVCTARTIMERISLAYPEKSVSLIPNGADEAFFTPDKFEKPLDLPSGPIVGYIGAWAYWVDHELITKLSLRFPNVNFVSIGVPYGDVPNYDDRNNVHILGQRSHDELIKYLQHFDVAIIPFKYHPITLATNPVKAYEYLATGVRVLSTAIPECIHMEPYVTTATTHADFGNKLAYLLSFNTPDSFKESRIKFARQNTWKIRGMQAHNIIENLLSNS